MLLQKTFFLLCVCLKLSNSVTATIDNQVLDVVIPCHQKDIIMLPLVIDGIKKYGKNVRRVIIVSPERFTTDAEWFDEHQYPFTKEDLAYHIFPLQQQAKKILTQRPGKICWIFQQLLKMYAPIIIPKIAPNVLVLDADTIFLNSVEFIDQYARALYDTRPEFYYPYFLHLFRLVPNLYKSKPGHSGIAHHMVFQHAILKHLFQIVENHHKKPFWQAFCACINTHSVYMRPCASEYEIYFNFAFFYHRRNVCIRKLKWANMRFTQNPEQELLAYKTQGYHCLSCHIPSPQDA